MKASRFCLALLTLSLSSFGFAESPKVDVLVWDLYFDFKSPLWPQEKGQGELGDSFNFGFGTPENHGRGPHGLQVTYTILKDQPQVRAHLAYNPGIPWQDPELCSLTDHPEFQEELERAGYPPHRDCRAEAALGISRLNEFIRSHNIRIVNISNGLYFDNYSHRNPFLVKDLYPKISMDVAFRFIYRNYIALGKILEQVIQENPKVLFVVAAGNNGDEVDRELFLKGFDSEVDGKQVVPTFFPSFTSRYSNVISIASSYDGFVLAGGSNYGLPNVLVAKKIGDFSVPDSDGSWIKFGGTSAAAAETTRLISLALSRRPDFLSPSTIIDTLRSTLRQVPSLATKVAWSGFIDEDQFLSRMTPVPLKPRMKDSVPVQPLPVRNLKAEFTEFSLPSIYNPRSYGCHSLAIDTQGIVWMTMPWASLFVSFNPETQEFKSYPLPFPESRPDGISIDAQGRIWAGVQPRGGFIMLDPRDGSFREIPHTQELTHNITAVDSAGNIWATGHQAKIISKLDPVSGKMTTRKILPDWPLDIRVAEDQTIWATGLKGYPKPWNGGALMKIDSNNESVEYFELPVVEPEPLQAFWIQPLEKTVGVTLMNEGFAIFHPDTKLFQRFARQDGKQRYQIVRKIGSQGLAMLNHHDNLKSIDIVEGDSPTEIQSLVIPNQVGEPREAIAFRNENEIWYCQNFTNVLGRAILPMNLLRTL